jgi:multidrug efflux pump subunit AcrB
MGADIGGHPRSRLLATQNRGESLSSIERFAVQSESKSHRVQESSNPELWPGIAAPHASENVLVDVTGALLTPEAIAKLNLWVDGRFYKLTDIAEIQHGYSDPATKMFRVNGKPTIGIGVNMRSGGNNLTFGEGLHRAAERLMQRLPVRDRPEARL